MVGRLGGPFRLITGDFPASLRAPTAVAIIPQGLLIIDDAALLLAMLTLE